MEEKRKRGRPRKIKTPPECVEIVGVSHEVGIDEMAEDSQASVVSFPLSFGKCLLFDRDAWTLTFVDPCRELAIVLVDICRAPAGALQISLEEAGQTCGPKRHEKEKVL